MAGQDQVIPLTPDSTSLSPLPSALRQGLTAVTVLACFSFLATTVTVLYLTYKLVRWHLQSRINGRLDGADEPLPRNDYTLGLNEQHVRRRSIVHPGPALRNKSAPNQFLVLVFNLLLADMHQSAAFLLNAVWVSNNGILVGTPSCWAQGWLVSTGDLASSCFIAVIAVHTYLSIVRNYRPRSSLLYAAVVGTWIFVYLMAIVGVGATQNGRRVSGFYVRAAAWCWINEQYETLRLVLHYLFIFIALALTTGLYVLIFLTLRWREKHSSSGASPSPQTVALGKPSPSIDRRDLSTTTAKSPNVTSINPADDRPNLAGGHHPAFLIYPLIYVVCTAPLAIGRIATMAGADVPLTYFCVAGALIASNGWLDVLLWGWTRAELMFGDDVGQEESGLQTFTFMRTPPGRRYGNMVWVEGASNGGNLGSGGGGGGESGRGTTWWPSLSWLQPGRGRRHDRSKRRCSRAGGVGPWSLSQESLRGGGDAVGRNEAAIQMDLVTTVVVEEMTFPDKADSRPRYNRHPSEASLSVNSTDKDVVPRV